MALSVADPPPRASAPAYTAESVVNAASFDQNYAPGTLVAIFGSNLSWTERWRTEADVQGDVLPTALPGTNVTVTLNGLAMAIEYAASGQVMFLLPPGLKPGPVSVRLSVAGLAGPRITIQLKESAPALYRLNEGEVMARRAETMEFVCGAAPVRPGDDVILYATGLGDTDPVQKIRIMPRNEAGIKLRDQLRILLNGEELPSDQAGYAGIMPGYPAFYEIRLRLPDELPADPSIRVCLGEDCSQEGLVLRTTADPPPAEETSQ